MLRIPGAIRRRATVAFVIISVTVLVLAGRLVDIQVVHAAALTRESNSEKTVTTATHGMRGSIVDDTGATLATAVTRYNVQISPYTAEQSGATAMTDAADKIGQVTGLGGPRILSIISAALKINPHSLYAQVVNSIGPSTYDRLVALNVPWMQFIPHQERAYPDGAVAGNILGFVNDSGQAQAGVERADNACLASTNGQTTSQEGADGVTIPGTTLTQKKSRDGGTLKLTINADLQWFAQQQLANVVPALGAQFGMVTVADAKTGQLRAVAQYPTVDPNDVSRTSSSFWGSLAFSTPFEPGSTFKSLTAAALIDQGLATPTTHVLTPGVFTAPGVSLGDAWPHGPIRLTLTGVLMMSSNVGMSILGQRLPDSVRYNYLKQFGIGQPSGIAFPGQSTGLLNPVSEWDAQTKYATMFGQGVSATQIQMVSAYQALANNGVRVPLSLVQGCTLPSGQTVDVPHPTPKRVISAATSHTLMGMLETIPSQGEDANLLKIPGYLIAAKTGTAQEPNGNGGYVSNKYYVSVMGAVPANDPQYVISVNLGYPTTVTSSAAAAPLFRTITSQVIRQYSISPSPTAEPNDPPYY